jgi:hypothetical protein
MIRLAVILVCVVIPFVALAAPVPPPGEKELLAKHWGKTEGEGEFELKGKQLIVRSVVPPSRGLISIIGGNGKPTMPRASRTVAGDFEVTVKVADAAPPNKDAKHTDSSPSTRAGVFIEGGGYAIEFHLFQQYNKNNGVPGALQRCVWVDSWFPGGGSGSMLKAAPEGKTTYLRITRRDKAVSVSYSFDGKEWTPPYTPRKDMAFPEEVSVGVFFLHSTYQVLEASFDGFTVEKPKPTEKEKKE